jgi:predicted ABC-type ATPase
MEIPRLRMFVGLNGSGKSTIKSVVSSKLSGHPVPTDKVITRYYRSLELLSEAIKYSNRAFIFDNSGDIKTWIAEITNGTDIEFKSENVPFWF